MIDLDCLLDRVVNVLKSELANLSDKDGALRSMRRVSAVK
jgi:hypothetical protein